MLEVEGPDFTVGPSDAPTPAPTGLRDDEIEKLRLDLATNMAKWSSLGIKSYSHNHQFTGLITPRWQSPIDIEVVDETLISRTFVDDGSSVDDADDALSELKEFVVPIHEQFGFIDSVIESAGSLVVTYNESLGYPSFVNYQIYPPGRDYAEPIIFSIYNLVPDNTTCPALGCCIDDCCGEGTEWDSSVEYCVEKLGSTGFNGTYSSDYSNGCVTRACCEGDCCGQGTQYDVDRDECRPG